MVHTWCCWADSVMIDRPDHWAGGVPAPQPRRAYTPPAAAGTCSRLSYSRWRTPDRRHHRRRPIGVAVSPGAPPPRPPRRNSRRNSPLSTAAAATVGPRRPVAACQCSHWLRAGAHRCCPLAVVRLPLFPRPRLSPPPPKTHTHK